MDDSAKVIRFPGKQKETDQSTVVPAVASSGPTPATAKPRRLNAALGLLAVILASVAVNRVVYGGVSKAGRGIASVGPELERDAAWEKSLAERLARPGSLPTAPSLGRAPSLAERLRFADLGDAYVVRWTDQRTIASVRARGEPIAIDAPAFLTKYGKLFDTRFATAAALEPKTGAATFSLRDADGRPLAEVRFAVDPAGRVTAIERRSI